MQEQGGAVARVQEVNVVRSEPMESKSKNGFTERVTWQIEEPSSTGATFTRESTNIRRL